jgi:SpoVK/Ycf46/Vps4 family AAA+-type ATPase
MADKPLSYTGLNLPATQMTSLLNWEELKVRPAIKDKLEKIKEILPPRLKEEDNIGVDESLAAKYRILFIGPAGSGKKAAATLLAKELNRELYKIDLAQVDSKYIGETEKNLDTLFKKAEEQGWILFFDESDELFGKRTEVKDSHDRYANQEVTALLERIEKFDGIAILASNMQGANIEDPYITRFNAFVDFTVKENDN